MFVNIFPKALLGLMHRTFPRHRFQPAMQPLVSPREYVRRSQSTPVERHVLAPEELNRAGNFTISKRQDEWLTVRICAKLAALQYHNSISTTHFPLQPAQIHIVSSDTGRPCLAGELPPELKIADISLSHGAGYGLALVADTWCGVDIQEPRESLLKVREKFCTPEEEELLQHNLADLPELQHLTLIWTAKEAAKKALSHTRMPGFLELILTETEPHTAGWTLTFLISSRRFNQYPATITVTSELYEGYGIALCLSEENRHA